MNYILSLLTTQGKIPFSVYCGNLSPKDVICEKIILIFACFPAPSFLSLDLKIITASWEDKHTRG